MSFLDFCFSSNWESERGWYIKFGYKGEMAPKLLIFFFRRGSTGESFFFHGLIDFILFFYTGLKNLGSLVSQIFFCLQPEILAMVRLPATNPAKQLTFLLFTSAEGKESPLPFWGPSQSFGFPLLPLGVRQPVVTKYQHLMISPLWPTFFLNGHLFDGLPLFIPTGG